MKGGFQLGPHTTLADNSSIFKMTILACSFNVMYKCMNEFKTDFEQSFGSNKGYFISIYSIFNNSLYRGAIFAVMVVDFLALHYWV